MPAATEVPSHADIGAFGAFGLEGSAKAVADAERKRITSDANVAKVLKADGKTPSVGAVVLYIERKLDKADNETKKRRGKEATEWLILALELTPYNEAVASLVRQLLGTQQYTGNLNFLEQWEPLIAAAQALLGKVGERMLAPLYATHALADRMSNAALLSHVVFHPATLHAAAAAKAAGVPIPKLSQEQAMPGLIAAMAKEHDFDDYAAMPEMACLLEQTLLAHAMQPRFEKAINELFGAGSEAAAWCKANVAPVKGFARGYVKLYADYLDLPSPRCQWVLDGLRCLITAPNHLGVYWIMAALTNRFRGIQQIKNPYPLSEEGRANRSYLLLVNAIIMFDSGLTIGEVVNGPKADRIFAEIASSTTHGQPQGRWERAVKAAVARLRSAAVAKLPARMSAEIQVTFAATAVGRSIMHYLYDIARGGNPAAVYGNFKRAGAAGGSGVEVVAASLWQACECGQLDRVLAFVASGANVNADDGSGDGATGLYIAAQNNHPDVVGAMINAGAAVDQARTSDGQTPLVVAAQGGFRDVVAVLVDGGADVDKARTDGNTPLIFAAQKGFGGVAAVLVAGGAHVDQVDNNGYTPLLWAAAEGFRDVAAVLVVGGADVDKARTDTGSTPLIMAAQQGFGGVVAVLVDGGADVNKAKDSGSTPLFMAASFGHTEVVKALLAAGADRAIRSKFGTALENAKKQGHTAIVALLE